MIIHSTWFCFGTEQNYSNLNWERRQSKEKSAYSEQIWWVPYCDTIWRTYLCLKFWSPDLRTLFGVLAFFSIFDCCAHWLFSGFRTEACSVYSGLLLVLIMFFLIWCFTKLSCLLFWHWFWRKVCLNHVFCLLVKKNACFALNALAEKGHVVFWFIKYPFYILI